MRQAKNIRLRAGLAYLVLTLVAALTFGAGQAKAAILTSGPQNAPYGGYVCADVANNNLTPGTYVSAFSCHGGSNQEFMLIGTTIYTLGGQRCLDVQGNGNAGRVDTPVVSYACTGGANQRWYYYNGQLITLQYGRCLDATTSTNGTVLVVNACSGANSQQWQFK